MAVNSISIEEIKALTNKYKIILEQYIAMNKSLSSLGSYDVLSNKKISGGDSSYLDAIPTVEACQAKCGEFQCSIAAYNSDTKGCQINNNGYVIDGSLSEKVIINKRVYYLNQLDNLNTQLSTINNQIIENINNINYDGTLTRLHDERVILNAQLDADKAALKKLMTSTANNLLDNPHILDLEYIQQNAELDTTSRYYMFILLALICLIAIVVVIITQIKP